MEWKIYRNSFDILENMFIHSYKHSCSYLSYVLWVWSQSTVISYMGKQADCCLLSGRSQVGCFPVSSLYVSSSFTFNRQIWKWCWFSLLLAIKRISAFVKMSNHYFNSKNLQWHDRLIFASKINLLIFLPNVKTKCRADVSAKTRTIAQPYSHPVELNTYFFFSPLKLRAGLAVFIFYAKG